VFQRNKSRTTQPTDEVPDEPVAGKGRPTPTRREAEQERKKRMKQKRSRKETSKLERQRRGEARQKAREAMETGDDRYLPARDKGPARRLCRDVVDSRYNLAEYLLPILVLILVLSLINTPWAVTFVYGTWLVAILGTAVDSVLLVTKTRRALRTRLPDASTKGTTAYTVMRSTQMRRLRLPKPQIGRGEPLRSRY